MSYGVVASKPAQVRVDPPLAPVEGDARVRSPWASGRLTLTSLHLTFVPTRTSPGVPALTIDLASIVEVDSSSERGHKTVHVRTADLVLHARVTGAVAFAKRLGTSVEAARRRGGGPATDLRPATDRPAADRSLSSDL
jgi:hypothetical protein